MKNIILIGILGLSLAQAQIKLVTETWPPYQIQEKDGTQTGISIDIVKEMQKRVGHTDKIKFYPWNRGYNMTLKQENYALFLTTRTELREELFKWVGPISNYELKFFKHIDNKKVYDSIESLKSASSIAVTTNDVVHQELERLGFKNLQVKTGGSSSINLHKIVKKKAEIWPSSYFGALHRIKSENYQNKIVMTKAPTLIKKPLNLAFNIKTSDEIIKKWQKALDDMKSDGTYDSILKKYK